MTEIDMESLRIMVVDDEPFMVDLLESLLIEIGNNNILTAGDGAEALEMIKNKSKKIDLIICDLEMPNMDGFEFVKNLRALTSGDSKTPVLILTGHSNQENIRSAVDLGIHGFITKPISRYKLESRVIAAVTASPIDPKVLKR